MKLSPSILLCLSTLFISACDPRFKTTTEICSTNQNEVVFVSRLNHTIKASDDEYQPYLQDILTALQITGSIEVNEQEALDGIDTIIKKYMPYEIADGEIQTKNALDILESIIATTDPATVIVVDEDGNERNDSKLIEAFSSAKSQVASGISADDGFCIYTNNNITIENYVTKTTVNESTGEDQKEDILTNILKAELTLTYDPFNGTFSQNIIMAQTNTDPSDAENGTVTNFVGFYDTPPNSFEAVGVSPPTVRFGSVNNTEQTKKFTIDDDFNDKLGQIEYEVFDNYCTLKNAEGEDYNFVGNTVLIVGGSNTFATTGEVVSLKANQTNDYILSVDDHEISINDDSNKVIIDTLIVNSSEPISDKPAINETPDPDSPIVITNNILTIDLTKTNSSVELKNDALYIDGVVQLDDGGGTLSVIADTAVIENNTLVINDAFVFGLANQFKIAVNCETGTSTRAVQREECEGGHFDSSQQKNRLPIDTGKRQTRLFDLSTDLTNLKRFRLETDYPNNTTKVYISEYREAIFEADGVTVIKDPTDCEGQAVLDDLYNAIPEEERESEDFEGVRLTTVPDSGYDFVYELNTDGSVRQDENGESIIDETQLPTPIFTFTGTSIPSRQ